MKKKLEFSVWVVIILAILLFLLRLFVFNVCNVSSHSMRSTLHAGDRVLINRLIPGIRNIENDSKKESGFSITRKSGIRNIKVNDIILFNSPVGYRDQICFDINLFYIKRCIGVPGDTIRIKNGIYKNSNYSGFLG